MAVYPNGIKTYTTKVDNVDRIMAAHINEVQDEITAIETELGINPSGSETTVANRLGHSIHSNVSGEIAAIAEKTTPLDADVTIIEDSAASNAKKRLSWANIKSGIKTYLEGLSSISLSGALGVTGATTLGSTLSVSGATTLGSTLSVSGATTLNDNVVISKESVGTKLVVHGIRDTDVSPTTAVVKIGGSDVHIYANTMDTGPWGGWIQVLQNTGVVQPLAINPIGGNVGIGTINLPNILTIQQTSTTDPIADSWTTYACDRTTKDVVADSPSVLDRLRVMKLYRWRRKALVHDEELESLYSQAVINGEVKKGDEEAWKSAKKKELEAEKALLPKYRKEYIGVMIDDPETPAEILNPDGSGIDLLGYIGYLHSAIKELAEEVDKLKSTKQTDGSKL